MGKEGRRDIQVRRHVFLPLKNTTTHKEPCCEALGSDQTNEMHIQCSNSTNSSCRLSQIAPESPFLQPLHKDITGFYLRLTIHKSL